MSQQTLAEYIAERNQSAVQAAAKAAAARERGSKAKAPSPSPSPPSTSKTTSASHPEHSEANMQAPTIEKRFPWTKRVKVAKTQRVLQFRGNEFLAILGPGEHDFSDRRDELSFAGYTLTEPRFEHALAKFVTRDAAAGNEFTIVETTVSEHALVSIDGDLLEWIAPQSRACYWTAAGNITIERLVLDAVAPVPEALYQRLTQAMPLVRMAAEREWSAVRVPERHVALFFVDGKFTSSLAAGRHVYWRAGAAVTCEIVDLRMQNLEVSGQEILTRDKVPLRINLTCGWRVADAVMCYTQQNKPVDFLYKELQFGLRAAVGTRTLDELLENKGVIDEVVFNHVAGRVGAYGLAVDSVGAKDIILPGEIKAILSKVVEAEKSALANVIRRREETAATRSLLNTAKVMEENPVAMRLKELEALERISEKIEKIQVLGGLDGILKDLVKLKA
jgi:regulator of protease activity HflC (stomatin/prohibitin superfamily)